MPPGTTSRCDQRPTPSSSTGTASASTRAPTSPRAEHLGQVAEQAEAGHVGGRVDGAASSTMTSQAARFSVDITSTAVVDGLVGGQRRV